MIGTDLEDFEWRCVSCDPTPDCIRFPSDSESESKMVGQNNRWVKYGVYWVLVNKQKSKLENNFDRFEKK